MTRQLRHCLIAAVIAAIAAWLIAAQDSQKIDYLVVCVEHRMFTNSVAMLPLYKGIAKIKHDCGTNQPAQWMIDAEVAAAGEWSTGYQTTNAAHRTVHVFCDSMPNMMGLRYNHWSADQKDQTRTRIQTAAAKSERWEADILFGDEIVPAIRTWGVEPKPAEGTP